MRFSGAGSVLGGSQSGSTVSANATDEPGKLALEHNQLRAHTAALSQAQTTEPTAEQATRLTVFALLVERGGVTSDGAQAQSALRLADLLQQRAIHRDLCNASRRVRRQHSSEQTIACSPLREPSGCLRMSNTATVFRSSGADATISISDSASSTACVKSVFTERRKATGFAAGSVARRLVRIAINPRTAPAGIAGSVSSTTAQIDRTEFGQTAVSVSITTARNARTGFASDWVGSGKRQPP